MPRTTIRRAPATMLVFALAGVLTPATVGAAAAPFPDFDGDGYGDLVIPAAREDVAGQEDAGALHVLYGSGAGLAAARNQLFVEWPGSANAEFGRSFAPGDFDADGYDDLAVGAPGAVVAGTRAAGAVTVLYGSATGLTTARRYRFTQATNHVPGSPEPWDLFAFALTAGDFDGDGYHDLAVGVPGEDRLEDEDTGVLHVLPGSARGLRATGSRYRTQDSPGVPGQAEVGDEFGQSLAAGDFDRDGYDDLAVGAPREDLGTKVDAGAVWVLVGTPAGPSGDGGVVVTQSAAGVAGVPEARDAFGWALAAGDVHGDGFTDLAVGVPGEDIGAVVDSGAVYLLAGSTSGLSGARSQFWAQAVSGVPGSDETQDFFGFALDLGEADGDGRADLAVGAVGEGLGGFTFAGAVTVLLGAAPGLTSAGARQWTQASAGVPGSAEDTELFGALVRFVDVNGDGRGDLAVGVPGESVDGHPFAGVVHVLPGAAGGPTATGTSLWHQGTAGITGNVEDDDWFGGTLDL